MKKKLFIALLLFIPSVASAQLTVPAGGTGKTGFPVNSIIYADGGGLQRLQGTSSPTVGYLTATSTATSTFVGGVSVKQVCLVSAPTICLGASGSGTVSSVDISSPNSSLSVGGGPITTTGTLSGDINLNHRNDWLAIQTFISASSTSFSSLNGLFVGRTGTTTIRGDLATSSFIGDLYANGITAWKYLSVPFIQATTTASSTFVGGIDAVRVCITGTTQCLGSGGSGTVTSVSGSGGTTGLTLTGGPITTSGTLTLGGTLATANGGTGLSNPGGLSAGAVLNFNGSGGASAVAAGAGGQVLISTGSDWAGGTVALADTDAVSGTLPIANGGTNSTTFIPKSLLWYNGTSILSTSTVLTVGSIIATTTASSTFAGGIDAVRICITGTTKCLGNQTSGTVTSIATNNGLTGGTITTTGTLGLDITKLNNNALVGWDGTNLIATGTGVTGLTISYLISTSTTATSTFAAGVQTTKIGTTATSSMAGLSLLSGGLTVGTLLNCNGTSVLETSATGALQCGADGGGTVTGIPSSVPWFDASGNLTSTSTNPFNATRFNATSTAASSTLQNITANEISVAGNTYGNRFRVANETSGQGYYGTDTSGNIYNMLTINSNNDMHLIPNFTGNHTYIGFNNSSPLTFGDSCCGGNPPASITFNTVGNLTFASGSGFFINFLNTSTAGNAVCQLGTNEIVKSGGTTCVTSSKRFKHDIVDLPVSGLDIVNRLRPVEFTRNEPTPSQPTGKEVGLIAEDVQEVAPRLVEYEADGVTPRAVRYDSAVAYLVKAIQELDSQVSGATRKAEENWQWAAIVLLGLMIAYQQVQIRKLKK